MELELLYEKALSLTPLLADEGLELYYRAPLEELMFVGNKIRQIHNSGNNVGWIIDRNVNLTNVCFSQCSFCNFCRKKNSDDALMIIFVKLMRCIHLGATSCFFREA
jgi:cyclic dehypoxanthinyl futalosine synthase